MEFFNNYKKLFWSSLIFFVFLTLIIAVLPALNNQKIMKPLPNAKPLTQLEMKGKEIYIANGCVACHTQQVRNVDMDNVFGKRPSISSDYAMNKRLNVWQNTATLMGSERTGPDLTDVGNRQPSKDWNLVHLYQPRSVVEKSVMPAFQWLFEEKDYPDKGDVIVAVPEKYLNNKSKKIVASSDALALVAYLQSLKQLPLPESIPPSDFLYKSQTKSAAGGKSAGNLPDGAELFTANCSSCHQMNGEGLPGAFPPLKGSPVVNGDNIELYVTIVMTGYNGRPGFGAMPSVGNNASFTPEMVTAIMNHERSSWGNKAKPVTVDQVKAVMDKIKK